MSEPDDDSLVGRAAAGDARAFAMLVRRHYAAIHRIAFRWCRDRDMAEDVAQDVCVKLGAAIRSFKGEAAFSTWLYRVTLNTVRDAVRASARQQRHVAAMALVAEPFHTPGLEDTLTQARIWDAVRSLPEQQRDAVLLVFGEELSHAQAGAVMGCKEATVSWHIHEAKKRLKRLVET